MESTLVLSSAWLKSSARKTPAESPGERTLRASARATGSGTAHAFDPSEGGAKAAYSDDFSVTLSSIIGPSDFPW